MSVLILLAVKVINDFIVIFQMRNVRPRMVKSSYPQLLSGEQRLETLYLDGKTSSCITHLGFLYLDYLVIVCILNQAIVFTF